MTLTGITGTTYRLDPTPIGSGGEGDIYSVIGMDYVAKIYKSAEMTLELYEKLKIMIENPPNASVLTQVAWPLDIVYEDGGPYIGFIMPKLSINAELGEVYQYPSALEISYHQKINIARNICAVISEVHKAGYVFGDFNPRNIGLDVDTGLVSFLDTDTYHVIGMSKDSVYRCNVCAPGYAAPELLEKCSDYVAENPTASKSAYALTPLPTFTKETDNFALAIHMFKLLMNGYTPYGGIIETASVSQSSPGIGDAAVRRDSYCFKPGYKHQSAAILPLEALPQEIADLFTRAFILGKLDPRQRPDAVEWHEALVRFEESMVTCDDNPLHQYDGKNSECPLCEADMLYANAVGGKVPAAPNLKQSKYTPPPGAVQMRASQATAKAAAQTSAQTPAQTPAQTAIRRKRFSTGAKTAIVAGTLLLIGLIVGVIITQVNTQSPDTAPDQVNTQSPDIVPDQASTQSPDIVHHQANAQSPDITTHQANAQSPDIAPDQVSTQISDIVPPSGNTQSPGTASPNNTDETYITIQGSQFSTALTELDLQSRGLRNEDIVQLADMTNLVSLYLGYNHISDITPLSGLTNLIELALGGNQISDITPLSGLTNLTWLVLSDNQINDVTPLSGLTNLTLLELIENQISDILPLSGLTKMSLLFLNNNQINDVTPLSGLTNLGTLFLSSNQIIDITPLSGLTNLTRLSLILNPISNITPLSGLTNLTELSLMYNSISNITPLSGLTNLTELILAHNQISDITPLSSLKKLTGLYLWGNQISDITPLSSLTNLEEISLYDNPIADWSPVAHVQIVYGRP